MGDLNQQDVERFARQIKDRREQLHRKIHDALIGSENTDYIELAGQVHDAGEASVADLVSSTALTLIDRETQELRDIEAALSRIRGGTYGICIDCGRHIDRKRLQAYLTAKRDVDCQIRYDQRRRGGRDQTPSL